MTVHLPTSVFSIAFLPAVMSPVLLLLLLVKLLAVVVVKVLEVVEVGSCLHCWTSHLDFYCVCRLTNVFSPKVVVVVVDYFRCCLVLMRVLMKVLRKVLMKVLVAILQERQEHQEPLEHQEPQEHQGHQEHQAVQAVQDRLDPDHHYYYLSPLISAFVSPLASPLPVA